MTSIAVLRHGDEIPLGWFEPGTGVDVAEVGLHRGDPLPRPGDHDGVVALGGKMGAYDVDRFPWLADEKRFLAAAASAGVPVLGVCLGCQLLAEALGGDAFLGGDGPEIGVLRPELTAEGRADPVARHLDGPVPVWHQDTWAPPPGATLVAETDRYPQGFRLGAAVGIQPHPEAGPDVIASWLGDDDALDQLRRAGVDAKTLMHRLRANAEGQRNIAHRLFGAWMEEAGG